MLNIKALNTTETKIYNWNKNSNSFSKYNFQETTIEKFDKLIAKMDEKNEPVNKNY